MDSKEPSFLAENQSVDSLVTQLHSYFRNSYSRFKIERNTLVGQIEAASEQEQKLLLVRLAELEKDLTTLGILRDALSIADRLLHTKAAKEDLSTGMYQIGAYTVHHDADHE
jgi:hypothetical protein